MIPPARAATPDEIARRSPSSPRPPRRTRRARRCWSTAGCCSPRARRRCRTRPSRPPEPGRLSGRLRAAVDRRRPDRSGGPPAEPRARLDDAFELGRSPTSAPPWPRGSPTRYAPARAHADWASDAGPGTPRRARRVLAERDARGGRPRRARTRAARPRREAAVAGHPRMPTAIADAARRDRQGGPGGLHEALRRPRTRRCSTRCRAAPMRCASSTSSPTTRGWLASRSSPWGGMVRGDDVPDAVLAAGARGRSRAGAACGRQR